MARSTHPMRSSRGEWLVEQPCMIWLVLFGLFFPLLSLATMGMRYTYLLISAHEAALQAALSKTFATNVSEKDWCARTAAQTTAVETSKKFEGIQITSVSTSIVISDTKTNTQSRSSAKLVNPADTTKNLYLLETTVDGFVDPLARSTGKFLGEIPGVTSPWPVRITVRKVAENPQGLHL